MHERKKSICIFENWVYPSTQGQDQSPVIASSLAKLGKKHCLGPEAFSPLEGSGAWEELGGPGLGSSRGELEAEQGQPCGSVMRPVGDSYTLPRTPVPLAHSSVTRLSEEAGILGLPLPQSRSHFGQRGYRSIRLFPSCLSLVNPELREWPQRSRGPGRRWVLRVTCIILGKEGAWSYSPLGWCLIPM